MPRATPPREELSFAEATILKRMRQPTSVARRPRGPLALGHVDFHIATRQSSGLTLKVPMTTELLLSTPIGFRCGGSRLGSAPGLRRSVSAAGCLTMPSYSASPSRMEHAWLGEQQARWPAPRVIAAEPGESTKAVMASGATMQKVAKGLWRDTREESPRSPSPYSRKLRTRDFCIDCLHDEGALRGAAASAAVIGDGSDDVHSSTRSDLQHGTLLDAHLDATFGRAIKEVRPRSGGSVARASAWRPPPAPAHANPGLSAWRHQRPLGPGDAVGDARAALLLGRQQRQVETRKSPMTMPNSELAATLTRLIRSPSSLRLGGTAADGHEPTTKLATTTTPDKQRRHRRSAALPSPERLSPPRSPPRSPSRSLSPPRPPPLSPVVRVGSDHGYADPSARASGQAVAASSLDACLCDVEAQEALAASSRDARLTAETQEVEAVATAVSAMAVAASVATDGESASIELVAAAVAAMAVTDAVGMDLAESVADEANQEGEVASDRLAAAFRAFLANEVPPSTGRARHRTQRPTPCLLLFSRCPAPRDSPQ